MFKSLYVLVGFGDYGISSDPPQQMVDHYVVRRICVFVSFWVVNDMDKHVLVAARVGPDTDSLRRQIAPPSWIREP